MKKVILMLMVIFAQFFVYAENSNYEFEYRLLSQSQLEDILTDKATTLSTPNWQDGDIVYMQIKVTKSASANSNSIITFSIDVDGSDYVSFKRNKVQTATFLSAGDSTFVLKRLGVYNGKIHQELNNQEFSFSVTKEMKK